MSMWGFARNATKSYLTNLNAKAAMNVVKGTAREFTRARVTRGMMMKQGLVSGQAKWWPMAGGVYFGGAEFGKRAGKYFMGGGTAGRITRIGTAAGAGLLAGNVVNPKNNWGPF